MECLRELEDLVRDDMVMRSATRFSTLSRRCVACSMSAGLISGLTPGNGLTLRRGTRGMVVRPGVAGIRAGADLLRETRCEVSAGGRRPL